MAPWPVSLERLCAAGGQRSNSVLVEAGPRLGRCCSTGDQYCSEHNPIMR